MKEMLKFLLSISLAIAVSFCAIDITSNDFGVHAGEWLPIPRKFCED